MILINFMFCLNIIYITRLYFSVGITDRRISEQYLPCKPLIFGISRSNPSLYIVLISQIQSTRFSSLLYSVTLHLAALMHMRGPCSLAPDRNTKATFQLQRFRLLLFNLRESRESRKLSHFVRKSRASGED